MTPSVLFDQSNTVYRMGTGVATYARNLAIAAQRCGFATQALLSTDIKIDARDPVLAEVQLFDVRHGPVLPWLDPVKDALSGVGLAPFGYRPTLLSQPGVVMRPSGGAQAMEQTFIGNRLFEVARAHFYVYRRLATCGCRHHRHCSTPPIRCRFAWPGPPTSSRSTIWCRYGCRT